MPYQVLQFLWKKIAILSICLICLFLLFSHLHFNLKQFQSECIIKVQNPYEEKVQEDIRKQWAGFANDGIGVQLFGKEKEIGDQQVKKIGLNEVLSDHISYNRTIPDTRNPMCNDILYDVDSLPSASVVLVYLQESYSVLLRSVYSLINTGSKNLKEIILVDDGNTDEEFAKKLDYYVETRLSHIVKVVHLPKTGGLIKARLAGARVATCEILIFMDAHSECQKDWLQPLALRIKEDRTRVLMPVTDTIITDDFHFRSVYDGISIGGFFWNGHFMWIWPSEREQKRRLKECGEDRQIICPYKTPTMVGGYLAIDREYFWEMGGYDEGMEGWGGENLEMSFRIWMCGGSIEVIPCSRIGHLVRFFHPYTLKGDTQGINTVRFTEVWLDEYKEFLYLFRPDLKQYLPMDLSDRKALRERLKCKSFKWYLENIYPEKYVPTKTDQGWGRLKNNSTGLCLDDLQQGRQVNMVIGVSECTIDPIIPNKQLQFLDKNGLLRYETFCFDVKKGVEGPKRNISLQTCNDQHDMWELTKFDQLRHIKLDMCLDCDGLTKGGFIYITACDLRKPTQKWTFTHRSF